MIVKDKTMKTLVKIFTKERIIYALIISIFGFLGTYYTARSQAASRTQEDLNKFKQTTVSDIGEIKGVVTQMSKNVEFIQGLTQTMQSRLDWFIDKQIK